MPEVLKLYSLMIRIIICILWIPVRYVSGLRNLKLLSLSSEASLYPMEIISTLVRVIMQGLIEFLGI